MSAKPLDDSKPTRTPQWPLRLRDLARRYAENGRGASDQVIEDQMWVLLHTALFAHLRVHSHRLGLDIPEELQDLATEKSLDLLNRISEGKWELYDLEPPLIVAYVSKVARNCLLDWNSARKRDRSVAKAAHLRNYHETDWRRSETPQEELERKDFAEALKSCAESLSPRSRLIWMLRVFLGLATKRIAGHPRIDLKPDHVDVLMQRARTHIRDCMARKGFDPTTIPAGCFGELLKAFDLAKSLPELRSKDERHVSQLI